MAPRPSGELASAGGCVSVVLEKAREVLENAWRARASAFGESHALRIFHGPTEAPDHPELRRVAVEFFRDEATGRAYAWVFAWEQGGRLALAPDVREILSQFLIEKECAGAVLLERPEKKAPEDATLLFGEVPEFLDVSEGRSAQALRYRVRFLKTKHPGLFLDHAPLRKWLVTDLAKKASGPREDCRVLNTFAYTGSLSVAAHRGGATRVVTLDLSKPTIAWAKENWTTNFGEDTAGDFIFGDVFEWLPRLEKRGDRFEVVILDPPSFSRSPKKVFSTAKDLPALHAAALRLLEPGGLLITSINSAQITSAQFRSEIELAAKREGRKLKEMRPLGSPADSFPGVTSMKGWIFRTD